MPHNTDTMYAALALYGELFARRPDLRPMFTLSDKRYFLTCLDSCWEWLDADNERCLVADAVDMDALAHCRSHLLELLGKLIAFVLSNGDGTWRYHTRDRMHTGFDTYDAAIVAACATIPVQFVSP